MVPTPFNRRMSSPEAPTPHATTSIEGRAIGGDAAIGVAASVDPARRGWLRLVVARCVVDRCIEIVEAWRQLRSARRTGRGHRRGGWRRLAHAAASLLLVVGGLVRGLALPWPAEAATIPFTMHTIITNFNGAFSVTHADLDRDGDLDVIATAVNDDDVVWWENDGTPADGGWVTHTIHATFTSARTVLAADVNGDGALDVLGTSYSLDDVTWWENDGTPADGGWTSHTITGSFDGAFGLAVADLDRDGALDVVGAAYWFDDVTWWENDGTPEDGGWTTHTIDGDFAGVRQIDVADLDADGDIDVFGAAITASDIAWWENDGTPADGGWTTHTIDASFDFAQSVAAVDLDGDGDMDVLGAAMAAWRRRLRR